MIRIVTALAALASLTAVAAAAQTRQIGIETNIVDAGNGGIRNVEAGPPGSNLVYLQDRRLRWYAVKMSGPCLSDRALDTIGFSTDTTGTFDRFSQITSTRYPGRVCGVTSIVTSAPPPGQPGSVAR